MGNMIDKDTWRIIEITITNYETYKDRLKEYEQEIIFSNGSQAANTVHYDIDYTKPQSVTELKALKLDNAYCNNLNRKIKAIEYAYNLLNEAEKEVIYARYWKYKKKVPYLSIEGVAYSERQMKRIVNKMITLVGRYLGEIR